MADSNLTPTRDNGPIMVRSNATSIPRGLQRVLLIALIVLAVIAASLSGLFIDGPYAPLVVGGVAVFFAALIFVLKQPTWGLFFAVAISLFPVGILPDTLHSILNRGSTVFALFLWLFNLMMWRQKIRITRLTVLMFIFLTWSAMTLLWTASFSESTSTMLTYIQRFIVCMLLIPNMVRTEKDLDIVAKAMALVGWVMVILSIYVLLTQGYSTGSRFTLFRVNANAVGTVALITTIGVFYNAIKPTHRNQRFNSLVTYFFMVAVTGIVALSGSRGGAISLGLTLIGFWFWKPTRQWAKLGLIMLVIGIFVAPFIFQTTLERFSVETGDTALGGREEIWQAAWKMIWDYPWLGVGIGNAPTVMKHYLVYGKTMAGSSRSLHNPILTIWAETGIFGLSVYLSILFTSIWLFFKTHFHHQNQGMTRSIPLLALTGSVFLGFLTSWVKGGGMESEFSYFLLIAFMALPSTLYGLRTSIQETLPEQNNPGTQSNPVT
jgi:O-antigen ligase